jgi:hypothetical protein
MVFCKTAFIFPKIGLVQEILAKIPGFHQGNLRSVIDHEQTQTNKRQRLVGVKHTSSL